MHKPYEERTDLEKIQSQWNKLSGLYSLGEWSAAVVRAATAAELTANYAIREEFKARSGFNPKFIDCLLRWANGLDGKINRLLLHLSAGQKRHKIIRKLKIASEQINNKRNAIIHQGKFCNKKEARVAVRQSKEFIETLAQIYERTFVLKDKKRRR